LNRWAVTTAFLVTNSDFMVVSVRLACNIHRTHLNLK
jgi:hypothetical protein